LFAAVMVWRFAHDRDSIPPLGVAAVVVWVLVSLFWFRDRLWNGAPAPKDALAATGMEHYRKELERRRDHLRNVWVWHGPLLLACALLWAVMAGKAFYSFGGLSRALPLIILLVVWTGFGWWRRRRQAGALQREIDEIEGE
jgi:hypothetical protein